MAAPTAVVTVTHHKDKRDVDSEVRVTTLAQLFDACRDAPPSALVRVSLFGPEGEVRLNFGSFVHRS
jgi:hypothetical protein